ncbi:Hsp33 family molecular chaperone HslO, partial [Parasphingorhabdus sp.]
MSFAIPAKNCRGRVVRLGPALDMILAAHAYPPMIRDILAEAVCLTAMLGALLKDEGSQLTLQAQTEVGVISLLACDYKDGALR